VDTHDRKRKSRSMSWTLFGTFAIGVAIGFSMCYALVLSLGRGEAQPDAAQAVTPTEEPAAEPVSTFYERAAELEFAPDIWAGRHLFIAVEGTALNANGAAFLKKLRPGGVVLRDANLADQTQTARIVTQIKEAVGFGTGITNLPLIVVNPEPGRIARFGDPETPTPAELGERGDAEAVRRIGLDFGQACRARGISVVFAPVLDIYEPDSVQPDLDRTAFGNAQGVVAKMGLALAEGIMAAGVIPVAKHYPGMGAARWDPETHLMVIERDIPELAELMYPFAEAAAQRMPGIMVGHVAVPVLEKDAPDTPASLSAALVGEVLREHWGFDGVIAAADMAKDEMTAARSVDQAAVEALSAGCDAVVYLDPDPARIHALCVAIEDAVQEGRLAPEELERSKQRLDGWLSWLKEPRGLRAPEPVEEPGAPEPVEPETAETVEAEKLVEPEGMEAAPEPTEEPPPNTVKLEYTVEPGDTLESLAKICGVNETAVIKWNRLEDETLTPGAKLVLYAPTEAVMAQPLAKEPEMVRREHTVQARETLFGIAEEYGVTVLDLLKWNGLADSKIREGQVLTLYLPLAKDAGEARGAPPVQEPEPVQDAVPIISHRIRRGETLGGIAAIYHTTRKKLVELNNLSNPDKILFGQKLKVPKP